MIMNSSLMYKESVRLKGFVRYLFTEVPTRNIKRLLKEEARTRFEKNHNPLRVAIDCGGGKNYAMSDKDRRSMVQQIVNIYGKNFKLPQPCRLHLVGVASNGEVEDSLNCYFTGFSSSNLQLLEVSSKLLLDQFPSEQIVYLTPTSPTALTEVTASNVYVIGGVVDCSVIKNLSEDVARDMDVRTARLPIKEHMKPNSTGCPGNLDLPINLVFDILVAVWQGASWTTALWNHMPKRKNWIPISPCLEQIQSPSTS